MKKHTTYFILCSILVLSTATTCEDWDDTYYGNYQTEAGYEAYSYLKETVTPQTDLLALVYHLNKYAAETTIEGRDSIDKAYFGNAKIYRERDNSDGLYYYSLTTFSDSYRLPRYRIVIPEEMARHSLDEIGTKWDVQASMTYTFHPGINDRTLILHITVVGEKRWEVTSTSAPDADIDSFKSENTWTVTWKDWGSEGLFWTEFSIEGSGNMESIVSPVMKMRYQTDEPLKAIYVGDNYSLTPSSGLWGLIQYKQKSYDYLTFWYDGSLNIEIDDSIEHTTDPLKVWIGQESIEMEYMGVRESRLYW